jgi:hypothetical protein
VIRLVRVWAKERPFGTELADVRLGEGMVSATGIAIGTDPVPYHLDLYSAPADGSGSR